MTTERLTATIFYSWQSDLPNATNRSLIEKALRHSVRTLKADESIEVEPVVDRDTEGIPGAPDIVATIFSKIDRAHAIVADLSIINSESSCRPTPNPSVLVEVGYALKALGPERVILVFNDAYGRLEDLPFDLRPRRILRYSVAPNVEHRAEVRSDLERRLTDALRSVFSPAMRFPMKASGDDTDIHDLLARTYDPRVPVSLMLAETLRLATRSGDTELAAFCEHELAGWKCGNDGTGVADYPPYRVIEAFLAPDKRINPEHAWQSVEHAYYFMRQHPEDFRPWSLVIPEAVGEMESRPMAPPRSITSTTIDIRDVVADPQTVASREVIIYYAPNPHQRVLAGIRQELAQRLLRLLNLP